MVRLQWHEVYLEPFDKRRAMSDFEWLVDGSSILDAVERNKKVEHLLSSR